VNDFEELLESAQIETLIDVELFSLSIHSRLFKKFLICNILEQLKKTNSPKIFIWDKEKSNILPEFNKTKIQKIIDDCVDKLNRYLPVYISVLPENTSWEDYCKYIEPIALQKIQEKQGKNLKRLKNYTEKYGLVKIREELEHIKNKINILS